MSLVRPRPEVERDVGFYTDEEYHIFDVKPGITDFSLIVSRPRALPGVQRLLARLGAEPELVRIAARTDPLVPYPPPGATEIETRW